MFNFYYLNEKFWLQSVKLQNVCGYKILKFWLSARDAEAGNDSFVLEAKTLSYTAFASVVFMISVPTKYLN